MSNPLLRLLGPMTKAEKTLYYERCAKAEKLLGHGLNGDHALYIAERTKQGEECRLNALKELTEEKEELRPSRSTPTSPEQPDLGL